MASDPFSDILKLTEAQSVISGGLVAGGDWAFRFRSTGKVKFYVVTEGGCWLRVEGQRKAVLVEQGDVLLLSGPKSFVLAGSPNAPPRDVCPVFEGGGTFARVGTRPECALLTGVVSVHPSNAKLLTAALPSLVHVRADASDAAALRWMIERIDLEQRAQLPGANIAAAQLAQLLFVQVLRSQLTSTVRLPPGWLLASRDEQLVRALGLMHAEPGRAWRLSDLAKAAGMSRARFAHRFKAAAGVPPLGYLTDWRMRMAQRRLREETVGVIEIARSLGYNSESAFSHAFKRVTGIGPRAYRNASP